jgi:hypothetical protein
MDFTFVLDVADDDRSTFDPAECACSVVRMRLHEDEFDLMERDGRSFAPHRVIRMLAETQPFFAYYYGIIIP